jgi:3-hydroxy acid dehydrogenase/malonic semialdehyde reductase
VRNRDDVSKWFAAIPAELLPASVLVNNAGLALGFESVTKGDPDDWDTMIDTNIKGLLYVSRIFLGSLPENAQAHVVNIGSVAGVQAYPNGAAYCGTKAAVKFISDAIRMEIVDRNIRVTNIQPGLVETEFSVVRFHGDADRAKKVYEGIKPLTADDIADIVLFAASAPQHVQIAEITITATHQASAMVVSRKPVS